MDKDSSKGPGERALFAGEAWFDPIEAGLRGRIRGLIEELVEQELEALIAGAYLAGTNTRRVQRALAVLFRGAVGKDMVSRA